MDRNNTTEEKMTSVLPVPPAFRDKDWAAKIAMARWIQEQVAKQRDENPVDVVEYRAIRMAR